MSCALGFVPVLKQVGIYLNVLCFRVNQWLTLGICLSSGGGRLTLGLHSTFRARSLFIMCWLKT